MKVTNACMPDNNLKASLSPKPFPMILSMVQNNSASSKGASTISPMSEIRQFKFSTAEFSKNFPNMFQYNDRSPLIFSSDDEKDQHEPSLNYKQLQHKNNINPHFQSSKNKQNFSTKQQAQSKGGISKEIIHSSQKFNSKIQQQIEEKKDIKMEKSKLKPQIEQIVISKEYPIQKSSWKKYVAETAFKQDVIKSTANKQILASSKEKQLFFQKEDRFNGQVSQFNSTNKKAEYISESNASKTDQVIDYIKIQQGKQKDIQAESQSERSFHVNQKYKLKNEEQPPKQSEHISNNLNNTTTVRRRRNKIFDTSFLKDRVRISSTSPQHWRKENYQARDKNMTGQLRRIQPQIKALNVLDKLVDQIGRMGENNNPKYDPNQQINRQLGQFLTRLEDYLKQINRLETIQEILSPKIVDKHIQNRKQIQLWKERIQKEKRVVSSDLQSWLTLQINKSFVKLEEQFESIDITIEKFTATKGRLNTLQTKMKDIMILMAKKQLKKLYHLLGDIVGEIQRLRQLKASCGKLRPQKMFEEYLEQEILLLGEIETQIRDNFKENNHSTK